MVKKQIYNLESYFYLKQTQVALQSIGFVIALQINRRRKKKVLTTTTPVMCTNCYNPLKKRD